MHSRIYNGWVEHRRLKPRGHQFRYRLFMVYLDLAELPAIFGGSWLYSARRFAPAQFKRADYLAPHDKPLDEAVRDLVAARTGARPAGPVRLLTQLRCFGCCMNPVSFYYCFRRDETLECIVADITNTPWRERHQYVLPVKTAARGVHGFEFSKQFHVSPFMPMDLEYRWRFSDPGERLVVHMENHAAERIFDATLQLRAEPATGAALARALARFPWITLKVLAAIYWQALQLSIKRTPFFPHPRTDPAAKEPACKNS